MHVQQLNGRSHRCRGPNQKALLGKNPILCTRTVKTNTKRRILTYMHNLYFNKNFRVAKL